STSNEPASMVANNSEAAADMTATAIGNQSGGLGMTLGDSYHLATTGTVGSVDDKGNPIASSNAMYDSTTGWHTLTVTKNITWGYSSVTSDFVYQYQFIDTAGKFQKNWKKGLINIMNFKFAGVRDRERGTRLDIDDTASGNWTITGLANFTAYPIFTGSYSRSGADTLLTQKNNLRTLNHSLNVTFANDTLIRLLPNNDKYFFLSGTANSTFHASDGKGNTFDRTVAITYNGNGTATLDVTRTKDGVTDTFTVDVVVGLFMRWGR
ncbi:MAG: hypothetical protein ACHQM6_09935, partial [Candidatus Kapaibacterium sp.]